MKVLLQRVKRAKVTVERRKVSEIGRGLVLLIGVAATDTVNEVDKLARKCVELRIFEDNEGKMNLSILDVGGQIMAVSQFTLYADTKKGRRPSFTEAASPSKAQALYELFVESLRKRKLQVETGIFGAHMLVEIHNDGPVTIILESG